MAALQAAGSDQGVDGLAGRDAQAAQGPIVPRGLQRDVAAAELAPSTGVRRPPSPGGGGERPPRRPPFLLPLREKVAAGGRRMRGG